MSCKVRDPDGSLWQTLQILRKLGEKEKAGSCKLESEGRQKEVSKYLMHHAKYLMMCGRVWKKGAATMLDRAS